MYSLTKDFCESRMKSRHSVPGRDGANDRTAGVSAITSNSKPFQWLMEK